MGCCYRPGAAIAIAVVSVLTGVAQDFEAIDSPERLSRREIETLRLMGGGHSNREIADAFGTTEGTVKNHVSNILLKLGVQSRTQAVLKGMELGYLGSQRRS
jgi:DNA-binding NarL/FixJ family response regulator